MCRMVRPRLPGGRAALAFERRRHLAVVIVVRLRGRLRGAVLLARQRGERGPARLGGGRLTGPGERVAANPRATGAIGEKLPPPTIESATVRGSAAMSGWRPLRSTAEIPEPAHARRRDIESGSAGGRSQRHRRQGA